MACNSLSCLADGSKEPFLLDCYCTRYNHEFHSASNHFLSSLCTIYTFLKQNLKQVFNTVPQLTSLFSNVKMLLFAHGRAPCAHAFLLICFVCFLFVCSITRFMVHQIYRNRKLDCKDSLVPLIDHDPRDLGLICLGKN